WREHVLQYKVLKQAIRKAVAAREEGTATPDQLLTAFTQLLDTEVARVNNFYMDRIEEGVIILHALRQQGDGVLATAAVIGGLTLAEQRHACKQSLVTFHLNLLILQNYVALNFMAIAKILKKWDKKTQLPLRTEYISVIVELPFYQCQALGSLVEDAEKLFAELDSLSPQPGAPSCASACTSQETTHVGHWQQKEQWQQGQPQAHMQSIS
ncbi:MAG: hypothetical protein SGPRY_011510, partial [Prymnesium sp.]